MAGTLKRWAKKREIRRRRADAVGRTYAIDRQGQQVGAPSSIVLHLEGWEMVGEATCRMDREVTVAGAKLVDDIGRPVQTKTFTPLRLGTGDEMDFEWRLCHDERRDPTL